MAGGLTLSRSQDDKAFNIWELVSPTTTLETFRFQKENDYEYEISFERFPRAYCRQKIDTPDCFIVFFSPENLALLALFEDVKLSPIKK